MKYVSSQTKTKPKKSKPSPYREPAKSSDRAKKDRVVQTMRRERQAAETAVKRRKRHKKNYILNYILIAVILLAVGASLSLTVLFNVEVIEVVNYEGADSAEFIKSLPIKEGDNIIRSDVSGARKILLEKYITMDDVKVSRAFPNKITIEPQMSQPKANVLYNKNYYVLSSKNRITQIVGAVPDNGAIKVVGIELKDVKAGDYLEDEELYKLDVIDEIGQALSENEITQVKIADISDEMAVKLYYERKYQIEVGGIADLSYKLHCAKSIIDEKLSSDSTVGIIDVSVNNGTYFFRPTDYITIPNS